MSGQSNEHSTPSRKQQHVEVTLTQDVRFRKKTTGLERLDFVNNALPELNFSEIDTSVKFLGGRISMPFMVSCMTGGYADAGQINRSLAEVCERLQIACGVGSQRQALEDSRYHESFRIVRQVAPTIPVVGNIGAAEVARLSLRDAQRLVDLIGANALAVHLNPLQEMLQPEGNTEFRGVLRGIKRLVDGLSVPVIVKEIGAGISSAVAGRLLNAGVRYIDVAGAGGTSWAGVEILREKTGEAASPFWDWGIPLATALAGLASLRTKSKKFTLIASGGVTSGIEAAKCIALGADLVASARPFLLVLKQKGQTGLQEMIQSWGEELRRVMFLTGSTDIRALQSAPLVSCETR